MKRFNNLIKNPLFSGSVVMIIGSNTTNFLNYIYHFVIGRLLGPSSYGELVSIISLIALLGILPTSLSLVVIKFISSAKNKRTIGNLSSWFQEKTLITSLMMFFLCTIGSAFIANFLKIQNILLIIIAASTFLFSLPALLNRSILQGLLMFKEYVFSMLAENSLKLILGGLLVYLGFSVMGALLGLLIAMGFGVFISRRYISNYFSPKNIGSPKISPLLLYSVPVILYSLAQTSLYSTDLILVKHFLSSYDSGIYAALSTLGKIVFFGTAPVGAVMFPIISRRQSIGQKYLNIFFYSFIFTLLISLLVLLIYKIFPSMVVTLLYGKAYLEASNLLIWFGIFIMLFTLSNLFVSFYLSLGKTKVVILPLLTAFLQILGIWFYHRDLISVISISILVSALLLLSLFVYFVSETILKKN